MGIDESDTLHLLHQRSIELDHLRLTHRDVSLKFKREQQVLKRLIVSLSTSHFGSNDKLTHYLSAIQQELNQPKDVSTLIPKLAILDRMLKQQSLQMDKQETTLDNQIRQSGETLLRVMMLPIQLKRELRNLLNFPNQQNSSHTDQAIRLLSIYDRAIKIITTNNNQFNNDIPESAFDSTQTACLSLELQNLIAELDFEGESGNALLDIRAELLIGVTQETLIELTLRTLKLVIDGTNYERQASKQFLDKLNKTLSLNVESYQHNVDQSQNYLEHRESLSMELEDLVRRGKENLQAQMYDEDPNSLTTELNTIFKQLESLTERFSISHTHEHSLQEKLVYNQTQLEEIFDFSKEYRRQLEDHSKRLQQDPLTKLYNRTAFQDKLNQEYHRWIRTQHNLRVILFDIDNFKSINTSYGYAAGDKVLKIIARNLQKEIDKNAIVARFGGEEFIALLPERDDHYAQEMIKSVQHKISKLPFTFREQQVLVTLSVVSTAFQEADTPESVLDRLGELLQQGKNHGSVQLNWT